MKKDITKAKHKGIFRTVRLFFRRLKGHWGIFLLLAISLSLAFLNFKPSTHLIGWDSLHPEFNPGLDLKRGLFSVWQEYRSTGLLAGMAHAADLPRTLLVYLFSILQIPPNLIRYLTTFLPLLLGPIGVYVFLYRQVLPKDLDVKTFETASFLGGLFYLLNLGTVQTFFVPFESFTWFYGAFPWLIYFITKYISNPSMGSLIKLCLLSLVAAPAFYVETIFVVFLLCLLPFFVKFLPSISALFAITIPQLFWLLPIIFFVFTNGNIATQNHINSVSSPETYERNLEFANLPDLVQLKGYLFKYLDLNSENKYEPLLTPWVSHLSNPIVYLLGFLFFFVTLLGIYFALREKFRWAHSLFGTILICSFFLLGGGLLINSGFPLIGELFRSPFTKFSIPFMFCFSIFFAIGTVFLLDLFTFLHSQLTYNLTIFTVFISLIIHMSPAFAGNLISPKMRVSIPNEYFELFDYMSTQDPSTRVANLPQYVFWGWQYYDWGYRGSGFLWYGLKQPTLDRAFDVWEKTSENYYEELSTAIYSSDKEKFENVIDKYAINWLLIDKHVIAPESKSDLGLEKLQTFLANNPKFVLDKTFNDQIFLYKVLPFQHQNFISITPPSTIYDLRSTTFNFPLRPTTNWLFRDNFISLLSPIPCTMYHVPCTIQIPSLTESENLIPVKIEYQKNLYSINFRLTPITPIFFLDQKQINLPISPTTISIPQNGLSQEYILEINQNHYPFELPSELSSSQSYYPLAEVYLPSQKSFSFSLFDGRNEESTPLTNILSQSNPTQCYTDKKDRKIEKITTPNSVTLLGTDVVACLSTPLPNIQNNRLLGITFSYFSPTLLSANVNVSDNQFSARNQSQPLEPQKTPKRTKIFISPSDQNTQLNLLLEAEDSKTVQEITYQDIYLTTHRPLASTKIKLEKIKKIDLEIPTDTKQIQVSLPNTSTPFDITQISSSNSLFPESRNCDQFNSGDVVKKISESNILYQSRNATQCDYLNLRHLDHSLNYLFSFDSQNQKGLNLTTCLENHTTRRCDIFERLSDTSSPQSIIQPIKNSLESPGYTLHLFNQSFGSRITANTLKSLSIHPLPLKFLEGISLSTPPPTIDDRRSMTSSHPYEFLYLLRTGIARNAPTPPSLRGGETDAAIYTNQINLYQTHSPYWQALVLPESYQNLTPVQITFKLIFDYQNLQKLSPLDNSQWYNSWQLPACDNNPCTIYHLPFAIIYLPQYLEFLGFFIFFVSFTALLLIYFIHTLITKGNRP